MKSLLRLWVFLLLSAVGAVAHGKTCTVPEVYELARSGGDLRACTALVDAPRCTVAAVRRYATQAKPLPLEAVEQRCSAAVSAEPPPMPPPPPPDAVLTAPPPPFTTVPVYFATDRLLDRPADPVNKFSGKRSRTGLSYGVCEVSIPFRHVVGEMEGPKFWKLEFKPDPSKHVTLLSTTLLTREALYARLQAQFKGGNDSSALLFVPGYKVTFDHAARRTAQIAYDLRFPGAAVMYSWPSAGEVSAYAADEATVEWSQDNLQKFLVDFLDSAKAERVYLIAHSMGNRALTRAVAGAMSARPDLKGRIAEIILTAPDIDAQVFKEQIAPALVNAGRPITLYASSKDEALGASRKFHQYPRAGESGASLTLISGIDTIDASDVDTSLLGHTYFAQALPVITDLHHIISGGKRASERSGLRAVKSAQGTYWSLEKAK